MPALLRVRDERGFTLIEVMVTMLILVVGIGGTLALIDGANARTLATKEREAGNALTREVIEAARSVPYRQLGGTSLKTAAPGRARTRGHHAVDGRVDGRAPQADVHGRRVGLLGRRRPGRLRQYGRREGSVARGSGTADRNPDDYKRLAVTVSWTRRGVTRNIKQTGVVNNEASSAGPDVEFIIAACQTGHGRSVEPSSSVSRPRMTRLPCASRWTGSSSTAR